MSQAPTTQYTIAPDLPLNPIEPGTSLLVMKPAIGDTHRPVMRLLAGKETEGLVLLSTTESGRAAIERYENCGGQYDPERMAVIDCSEAAVKDQSLNVHPVSGPDDLTGISILFSSLYQELYDSGTTRVRTGFLSLSPLLVYVDDFRPLFRFLNSTTGRISRADGLGCFVLDPESIESDTFRSLTAAFDGGIRFRETEIDGEYELRVRGLPNQPDGWQPFDLSGR